MDKLEMNIIELAKEAGLKYDKPPFETMFIGTPEQIERFADLVRAEVEAEWIETNKALAKEIIEFRKSAPVKQEPVWYYSLDKFGCTRFYTKDEVRPTESRPLYAAPAQPVNQEPVACPVCSNSRLRRSY